MLSINLRTIRTSKETKNLRISQFHFRLKMNPTMKNIKCAIVQAAQIKLQNYSRKSQTKSLKSNQ